MIYRKYLSKYGLYQRDIDDKSSVTVGSLTTEDTETIFHRTKSAQTALNLHVFS
jgi:hypothetical protein